MDERDFAWFEFNICFGGMSYVASATQNPNIYHGGIDYWYISLGIQHNVFSHICVGKLTIIGSDNGLSPGRCQAITLTNTGILLNIPLVTNFNEILIEI